MSEPATGLTGWALAGVSGSTFRVQFDQPTGRASITVRHKPKGDLEDRVETNRLLAGRLCRYIERHGLTAAMDWLGQPEAMPDA
jgi:hypothetical protein